jgi:hypothetical protein
MRRRERPGGVAIVPVDGRDRQTPADRPRLRSQKQEPARIHAVRLLFEEAALTVRRGV